MPIFGGFWGLGIQVVQSDVDRIWMEYNGIQWLLMQRAGGHCAWFQATISVSGKFCCPFQDSRGYGYPMIPISPVRGALSVWTSCHAVQCRTPPAEATCNLVCNIQCRGTVLTGHIKRSKQPKLSDHPIVVFLSHLQCPPAFQDKELLFATQFYSICGCKSTTINLGGVCRTVALCSSLG